MSKRKATLEERTAAFLRQCARGRSKPHTLARKAGLLLADKAGTAPPQPEPEPADYMNPRPGWWPESGFAAQDRPDWS